MSQARISCYRVRLTSSARTIPLSAEDTDFTADDAILPETEETGAGLPTAELQAAILTVLDDDQAEDIVTIDLAGKSSIADTMIIASGRSQRHVAAIADHVLRALKDRGHGRAKVEGLPNADWVLIDAGDVIAHIFRPDVRSFYAIERMWVGDQAGKHMREARGA